MLALTSRYSQRRAFVTGAASGLGRALCRALAADGWTLGMADVDAEGLDDAAEEIRSSGGTPHPVTLDVTDAEAFEEAAADFVGRTGGVDLVVNNAGIAAAGPFEAISLDAWDATLSVNVMGVVHGCRAFLPHLRDGGGHLLNVASIAAEAAAPRMAAYNVSKAAVRALSETLYGEVKDDDVHVGVLMPAFFQTNIDRDLRGSEADRSMTRTLMERSGLTADDVAMHALEEAGQDGIHIIYPSWMARIIWHWKRLFPKSYVRSLPKRAREAEQAAGRMEGTSDPS